MKKIIIAIDGQSGCGKSSTAKEVARYFSYQYIDSGAMYRATTYFFLQKEVDVTVNQEVREALSGIHIGFQVNTEGSSEIMLNGQPAESRIRTMDVNNKVSEISAISEVRKEMVRQQRIAGKSRGVVMDGRDIGTVVFPDAELKIFMRAELETRAKRRQKELQEKGISEELSVISNNLKERDLADSSRADSPLRRANDAVEIDTTNLTFDEQVHKIVVLAEKKINEG